VNRTDAQGGRLAALWRASDIFSVKFSALLQRLKEDGQSIVDIVGPIWTNTGSPDRMDRPKNQAYTLPPLPNSVVLS